jgi:hypothetical protein
MDNKKIINLFKILDHQGDCSGVNCKDCFLKVENLTCIDDLVIKHLNNILIQLKLELL